MVDAHESESPADPGRRRLLSLLALSVASLFVTCGVAEIGFRLAGYSALYDVYSRPSLFWVHDDKLGWVHEAGAAGTYIGPRPFPVEYQTPIAINSEGLRGPEILPKAPGEYRVLVLGDSVVAAFEVAYEDTFTALLERRLASRLRVPVKVINAGVRGYGTDQEWIYYREHGRALDPDLVVLMFSPNDPNDNVTLHRVRRPFGKSAFALGPDGALTAVGMPVPQFPLCSAWMLDDSYAPRRDDGPLSRLACALQVRAADRSALFTFMSQTLGRNRALVTFLKDLSYPDSQDLSWTPKPRPLFRVAGVAHAGEQSSTPTLEWRLTTALLLALDRSIRADGVDFIVTIGPRHLKKMDAASMLSQGIDFWVLTLPPRGGPPLAAIQE